jgi:hypothetical protein
MSEETRVKQIMLDAIIRHKEASTMSLRTAGAVVNAIYNALEKANVLAKIEKRHSPEKSGQTQTIPLPPCPKIFPRPSTISITRNSTDFFGLRSSWSAARPSHCPNRS